MLTFLDFIFGNMLKFSQYLGVSISHACIYAIIKISISEMHFILIANQVKNLLKRLFTKKFTKKTWKINME